MLHIEYQISEDDFVAAGRLVLRHRSKWRAYLQIPFMVLGATMVVFSAFAFGWGQTFSGGACLLYGTFLLCLPLLRTRALRRTYRKRPSTGKPLCLEISDSEVHLMSPDMDSRTSWALYDGYLENDSSFVLLQQGRLHFIPIPKGQLAPEQLMALRAVAAAHVPQI